MAYLTLAAFKSTLSMSAETYADADITAAITAAESVIDNYCHRRGTTTRLGFEADADATQVRYFTPAELYRVDITDLVTFTSLATDPAGDQTFPDAWTTSDYALEPLNAPAEGWPYTRISVRPSGSFVFPIGYVGSVKVTGKWGWAATPGAINEATTILTSRLLKRARETPFGVVSINLDGVAVRLAKTDPDVAQLLGPYVKHRIAVA